MVGTKHFTRMQYHVARGLREILAPRQTMTRHHWEEIKREFDNLCVFCGAPGSRENRGIVADHLIPVTQYGELVLGNTVPACQTCNDSRGDRDWRTFVASRFPNNPDAQVAKIEEYVARHPYQAVIPTEILTPVEFENYEVLLSEWKAILVRAHELRNTVATRRESAQT